MDRTVLTLRVCGWSSIAMGLVFFLVPGWYAELEAPRPTTSLGFATSGPLWWRSTGLGPACGAGSEAERRLYDVVMLASVLETIALAWSTFTWEFTATEAIFITGPLALAALVSIALVVVRPRQA